MIQDNSIVDPFLQLKRLVAERIKESIDWRMPDEAIMGIQVLSICLGYIDYWCASDRGRYITLSVEEEIVCDVVNPATGRPSTIYDHASKFDGFIQESSEEMLLEHKSTSDDLRPESPYWRKLTIDSQVSKYILSARQNGHEGIAKCLYNVVSKPTTNPKQIVKAEVPKIAATRSYCGQTISDKTWASVHNAYQQNKGTKGGFNGKLHEQDYLELYGLRLLGMMRDEPSAFFGRRVIVRTEDELKQYAAQLWQITGEIRVERKTGVSYKNTQQCFAYNRQCEYFRLCTKEADAETEFHRPAQVHKELNIITTDGGRDVITNSRINCFMQCREKHRLRYEEGLRKIKAMESDALRWGTLFHEGMEVIWGFYKGEQDGRLAETEEKQTA